MTASRESVIVVSLAVLSLCPVIVGIAVFPSPPNGASLPRPWCAWDRMPYPGSVTLSPQSPVLLPKFDQYNSSKGSIGFQLDAPADFSGSWAATSGINLYVWNITSLGCVVTIPVQPPHLNGTFNLTLFPGNYVVLFSANSGAGTSITATQPWIADFDRGLDVLQGPDQIALPANGSVAWTITAPSHASRFFFEEAIATNSCDAELAVLPPAVYRAFAAGEGPLNGNVTDVLDRIVFTTPAGTISCAPSSGTTYSWCEGGPFNWTSGDVAVFYNGADFATTFYPFGSLEVSYLIG